MNNGSYEITGCQPIPGSATLDFAVMAQAVGFPRVFHCTTESECQKIVPDILHKDGPVFVCVTVESGEEGPISRGPHEQARYLQSSLAESARQLRDALASS